MQGFDIPFEDIHRADDHRLAGLGAAQDGAARGEGVRVAEERLFEIVDDVREHRAGLDALGEPVAIPGVDVERRDAQGAAAEQHRELGGVLRQRVLGLGRPGFDGLVDGANRLEGLGPQRGRVHLPGGGFAFC